MKTYAEVSAYYNNGSGAYSQNITSRSNAFKRQAAFPLEVYSIFPDLETAKLYATGHSDARPDMNFIGLPYEGQVIAVKNNGKQELYVLDQTLIDSPLSGLRKITDFDELSGASSNISSSVDEKIKFLSSFYSTPLSGNLSVIKVTDDDYLAYCNAVATSSLISNAIYILDLSVTDVFNQRIVHVGTPIDNDDAATKKMVDDLSISLSGYFKRDIENTILCSNTFRETQNFNNISSYSLSSNNGNITNLTANYGNITSLTANSGNITSLTATNVNSTNISANQISSTYLKSNGISAYNLSSNNISSQNLSSNNGNITNLTANNISSDNLSSTNINSQNLSADKFTLSIGSIISNYVKQSNISVLTVEDKLIVEEDCYLGNSTTIHIGESNTLCTLLSNNFTPLSNAISSKIYTGTELCGNYTNLSVIKISKEDYEQKVVDAARAGIDLSDDVLYIISSDYIDAYEQQIKNVVMTDDNTPSEATNKHYVDKLYSTLSNTYQVVSALSDAVSSTANVGDIAVVSSYISLSGNQPISRTAYYWTGSGWGALDGNYDATKVYFSENLKYTNAIGALPAPSEGQGEINAAGLNLKNVLESILVKEKSGTKTNPSITTTNSTKNVLYGTILTPSYYFAFEDGNYQYGPDPTGSEVSSWKVKTNGNELTLPLSAISANSISSSDAACNPAQLCATFSTNALSASIYQISAYVSYTPGDVPYTNTHNPDSQASARISASYATNSLNLYNVYKPCFWKITTTPTTNITSAAISSLSPSTGMNQWNVLSNGTWKTTYNCTSPWYEIFFLAPKGIAGHGSWSGKDANNMTVKVEPATDVEFTHENVGNDEYKLFIVRNADVYGATTVTMEFAQ